MKSRLHWQRRPVSPALSPASALGPAIPEAGPATMARKKGRFLSPSSGFAPEAIKLVMQAGKPGHAFAVRRRSATNRRWDGHWGNDSGPFTAGRFAQFDGLFFYPTGELTVAKHRRATTVLRVRRPATTRFAVFFIGGRRDAGTFYPPSPAAKPV